MWGSRPRAGGGLHLSRLWRLQHQRPQKFGCVCAVDAVLDFFRSYNSAAAWAYLLTVLCVTSQAVLIDVFLVKNMRTEALMTLAVDAPLLLHIIYFWREDSAHRAVPTQWLCYSWLHAAKVVLLFCRVMPRLPAAALNSEDLASFVFGVYTNLSEAHFKSAWFSATMLTNLLLFTPVIYALLMFRVSRSIFGAMSSRVTVDLIMHYDMLWHVVIDMVDQADMFNFARLAERVGHEYVHSLVTIQTIIPVLLFFSIVLQAQAMPGVVVDQWAIPDLSKVAGCDELGAAYVASAHVSSSPMRDGLARTQARTQAQRRPPSKRRGRAPAERPRFLSQTLPSSGEVRSLLVPPALLGKPAGQHAPDQAAPKATIPATNGQAARSVGFDLRPELGSSPGSAGHLEAGTLNRESPGPASASQGPSAWKWPTAGSLPRQFQPAEGGLGTSPFALPASAAASTARAPRIGTRSAPAALAARRRDPAAAGPQLCYGSALADASSKTRWQWEKERRGCLQGILHLIQRHNIILARKRSCIISIFFIDFPFLALRLWLWFLMRESLTLRFPGFGVKNGICIVLNVMQFPLISLAARNSFQGVQRQLAAYRLRFGTAGDGEAGSPVVRDGGAGFGKVPQQTLFSPGSDHNSGGSSPLPSTPAFVSTASPLFWSEALGSGWRRRSSDVAKCMPAAERQVRRETVRSTGICAHFWALFLAFSAGLLLAYGDKFIARCARQVANLITMSN